MLKLWGMGGKFVEAPSPSPLFFIRQSREPKTRAWNANLARQHLQNVVIAEAMLLQQKAGTLTRRERKEIAGLCDWSLSKLYENDWAAFQQYWQWLREIEPNFIPRYSRKLKVASMVLGYESAEGLALARRWIGSRPARAVAWISSIAGRSRNYTLRGDAGASSGIGHDAPFALTSRRPRFVGAAALILVVGAVALAGMMATGQLGGAARTAHPPLHPRMAEAPHPSGNLASDELPLPIPAAKVDRRSEIVPIDVRPVAKTRVGGCARAQRKHQPVCRRRAIARPHPRRREKSEHQGTCFGRTARDENRIGGRGRARARKRTLCPHR